jgi:DNA-binding transcriptional ArsR family regulator
MMVMDDDSEGMFAPQARRLLPTARALADASRLRILLLLTEREATVSELSTALKLPQPRVSGHLRLLANAGLVASERVGRWRYYTLLAERVESLLTGLHHAADADLPSDVLGDGSAVAPSLRRARRCYDHLAGSMAVDLLIALLTREWLKVDEHRVGGQPRYVLTEAGSDALTARGVDLTRTRQARRMFAVGCPDWTEDRPHLGGALGHEFTTMLQREGVISVPREHREVSVHASLPTWLDPPR